MVSNTIIIAGYKLKLPDTFIVMDDFWEKIREICKGKPEFNSIFTLLVVERKWHSDDVDDYGIYFSQNNVCLPYQSIITDECKKEIVDVLNSNPKKLSNSYTKLAEKLGCEVSPFNIFSEYYDLDLESRIIKLHIGTL